MKMLSLKHVKMLKKPPVALHLSTCAKNKLMLLL
jgi:hypothetical protein